MIIKPRNDINHSNTLFSILECKPKHGIEGNYIYISNQSDYDEQNNTNKAFSTKWRDYKNSAEKQNLIDMQKSWYLECYGFSNEQEFADFLSDKKVIYDAGCGIGFKAAWFANLAPHALVVGVDFSDAARFASEFYADIPNLFFIKSDIATDIFKADTVDYVSCDQVIMHTQAPLETFKTLTRTLTDDGQFACYFYAKKAMPRELLDEHFRNHCTTMSHDEIKEMSAQLTELGKRLSDLNITIDSPEIPALGIKGGEMDIQRFIYWNFIKCYWNPDLGRETSDMINFDWYSPSNAERYSKEEIKDIVSSNNLNIVTFHEEEACYCGRFNK